MNVYKYPIKHHLEMSLKYKYIALDIWFGMEYRKKPPLIRQLTLFPTLEEQFLNELPDILKRGTYKITQIKWLAKKYNVPILAAKKAYKNAMRFERDRVLYEDYCRFKDYFDWKETPDYLQYCKNNIAELDAQLAKKIEIIDIKINNGEEHIVLIDELSDSLNDELDRHIDAYQRCQSPVSWLAERMTRHDFDVLNSRGLIEIIEGNPDTLANHPFLDIWEDEENQPTIPVIYKCQCGTILDFNIVGLNKKLGAISEADYKCLNCLEMTEKKAQDLISFYKNSGCNLFV